MGDSEVNLHSLLCEKKNKKKKKLFFQSVYSYEKTFFSYIL